MTAPLIHPPTEVSEIEEMEHDDTTPACRLCGAPHIGVMTPAFLALRGSYIWMAELGCEVFVLDDQVQLEFLQMPNGAKAIVVDVNPRKGISGVAHEDCVDSCAAKLEATIDMDPEEILELEHRFFEDD